MRGRALPVLVGCFVCQMGLGVAYVFGPLLKHVVAEFDWSRTVYAVGNAPLLLAMALGNSAIGDLTERFGARRVLVAASLLLGASLFCSRTSGACPPTTPAAPCSAWPWPAWATSPSGRSRRAG